MKTLFLAYLFSSVAVAELIPRDSRLTHEELHRRQYGPVLEHKDWNHSYLFLCIDKDFERPKDCETLVFIKSTPYMGTYGIYVEGSPNPREPWDQSLFLSRTKIKKAMARLARKRVYRLFDDSRVLDMTFDVCVNYYYTFLYIVLAPIAFPACAGFDILSLPFFRGRLRVKSRKVIKGFSGAFAQEPLPNHEILIPPRYKYLYHNSVDENVTKNIRRALFPKRKLRRLN